MVPRALLLLLGSIIGLSSAQITFDKCNRDPISTTPLMEGTPRTAPNVSVTVIGGNTYMGEQTKQVSVDIIPDSGHVIVGVIMQMVVRSASTTRRGNWSVVEDSEAVSVAGCHTDGDTVVTNQPLDHIEVTWTAPPASANNDEVLELSLTMVSDNNRYWKIIAAVMREVVNTNENDDRDMERLHDPSLEVQLMINDQKRRQQLNLEEDLGSEGDWTEEKEAERRREWEERRAEETQYEITLQKEEMERMDRLRQEIRDKEEWDRDHPPKPDAKPDAIPNDKNPDNRENEIDLEDDGTDINGATTTVSMLSVTALTFLTCFLLL